MFYKLKFHSQDYYQEFYDEQGQPNMKSYLEHILFTLIQKAEKERYLEDIFYAITEADNQDIQILLAYPELINPSDDLIYGLMDHLNLVADEELMSRLVEPEDFGIEVISSSEFLGKISIFQTRLYSVAQELQTVHRERSYEYERKYKEFLKDHPEQPE